MLPVGFGFAGREAAQVPSPHVPHAAPAIPADALTIDQHAAARLTSLSAKTLGRLADEGAAVGRIKIGRRVLSPVPTLSAWLARKAEPAPAPGFDS